MWVTSVSRFSTLLKATVAVAIVLVARDGSANSRYPASKQIYFSPQNSNDVALRVTYGVLVSADRGQTWRMICESAIGAGGNQDPMYALTPSGAMIGSIAEGLVVSSERGCSWSFAQGIEKTPFVDVAANPADRKNVVAFASSLDPADGSVVRYKSSLWETKDEGKTFTAFGSALDTTWFGETVDLTASDPARIYLTAEVDPETAPKGRFIASADHGTTWESYDVPFVGTERRLFIAGIDPNDASRVYVRTWGGDDAPARLLVSDDAGKNFRAIFTGKGSLPAFALSADGTKVWAGGRSDGVNVASTTDFSFVQRTTRPVECLTSSSDGLWACSDEKNGFVVGLSADDGVTFTAKLHFCDVLGPLECAPGTSTYEHCAPTGPVGCIREEPDDEAGVADASKPSAESPPPSTSNCGCTVGLAAAPLGTIAVTFLVAASLLRRRRR